MEQFKGWKKGETCITEVLAQKRKSQDTNLFSVPVRHIFSLLPLPFFHMRWSARKYFFNYIQMFIFFWLPQGQTQSLFYYHLFFSFFFFCHRASLEQSPNKGTTFSSKVVKVFYKGEWVMRVPPAQHTMGCIRDHTQLVIPHPCPIRKCY